jgi:hypothetical protein
MITGFNRIQKFFEQIPSLKPLVIIDYAFSTMLMLFSIYTGYRLWAIRPGAVRLSQKYLLASAGYDIFSGILPFIVGLPNSIAQRMATNLIPDIIRGLIYSGVWYTYLERSKRVKTTYNL